MGFTSDPVSRWEWLTTISEISGQSIPRIESSSLRVFLLHLLRFAANQATPEVLRAIAEATAVVHAQQDQDTEHFQRVVRDLSANWDDPAEL